jgi:hypothetical protein
MLIVQLGEDQKRSPLISNWNESYLTAEPMSFGDFYIGIDTVAPKISGNGLLADNNLTGRKEMRIKITDDLSGIKSYQPEIDGKWALFEYDQKNDVIIYRFDEKRIKRGTEHNLNLKVTDNKENISEFNYSFLW